MYTNPNWIYYDWFVFYSIPRLFVCLRMRMSTSKQYANVNVKKYSCVWGPLREYRSIRTGASGLPCYCAPLVCVSEVIELLAVCWYYKPNTKTVHVYTAVCTWHARTTHTYTHHTMMNFPHDSSSTKSLSKLRRNIQNCSDESAPPI